MKKVNASHMDLSLYPKELERTAHDIVFKLREFDKTHPFDAIAFCGMSGAIIAGIVALRLDKNLLLVRKVGEVRHSYYDVEGDYASKSYVIVDDFISSGATVKHIVSSIRKACNDVPKLVGVLSYFSGLGKLETAEELQQSCTFEKFVLVTMSSVPVQVIDLKEDVKLVDKWTSPELSSLSGGTPNESTDDGPAKEPSEGSGDRIEVGLSDVPRGIQSRPAHQRIAVPYVSQFQGGFLGSAAPKALQEDNATAAAEREAASAKALADRYSRYGNFSYLSEIYRRPSGW